MPEYDILHTQGKEYIVEDIMDVMKERGVVVSSLGREKSPNITANPILLQMKYTRVIECFARQQGISLDEALNTFYHSQLYCLMREGVSDMHCMSDEYLADELEQEYQTSPIFKGKQ